MLLKTTLALFGCAAFVVTANAQDPASSLPHLERRGIATQLIVHDKPYLVLGGELHNSSSSSLDYMQAVWPRMTALHVNTLLTPVAWETIEPTEGYFDFHVVDGLLEGARANHLKLVVLWFGAWKNTYSSYVPAWVKRDGTRFPRVQMSDGRGTERLSPFSAGVRTADTRAFVALMHHLHEVDGQQQTVLMVQVENEVGVIPESRDHSPVANAAFSDMVPSALTEYLVKHRAVLQPELRLAWEQAGARTSGSWQEVFGSGSLTDDLFMAWQYAAYIQAVTVAGKSEYPLPMYVNAALIRPNYEPGQYNSGGPLPHSLDVWRAAGKALDFFSPDIYFNEFAYWAGRYAHPGNPLFIPEAQVGQAGAANALYAFGRLSAIGFSGFGIDDQGNAPLDLVGVTKPGERPDVTALGSAFSELTALAPKILEAQRTGAITAALLEGDAQRAARVRVGEYMAQLQRAGSATDNRTGVLFLQQSADEFLVAGVGDAQVAFTSDKPSPGTPIVGLESVDELFFRNGAWVTGRRMNGDENGQGQSLRIHHDDLAEGRIYRVRLYRYPGTIRCPGTAAGRVHCCAVTRTVSEATRSSPVVVLRLARPWIREAGAGSAGIPAEDLKATFRLRRGGIFRELAGYFGSCPVSVDRYRKQAMRSHDIESLHL